MLFSYGVHTSEKGKNLKCFLLRCNLFVSVSFIPPVILVMIYEALYIKVLKHSSRLSLLSIIQECISPKVPQGGSIAPCWLVADLTKKEQKGALLYKRLGKGDRRGRENGILFFFFSFDDAK